MATYRTKLMLSLGPISAPVDLITVLPSESSGLKRICPTHHTQLKLRNICVEGDHTIEWNDWLLGAESADGFKVVNPAEKPQFEADAAIKLTPVPRNQLDSATVEGSGIYYCKPSNEAYEEAWATLRHILSDSKVALVAKAALKKGPRHLYRLTVFNDYLVLRQVVFPEKVTDAPALPQVKLDKELQKIVKTFVDQMLTDFSTVDVTDENKANLKAWLDTGDVIENPNPKATPETQGTAADAVSMLEALKAAVQK